MKTCKACLEEKPLELFCKDSKTKSGYGSRCQSCENERKARYRRENPDKFLGAVYAWRMNNKDMHLQQMKRANQKRTSTAKGRLEHNIRRAVNGTISRDMKGGKRVFDLLDYTIDELKDHLEAKFADGMNWNNYGEWHVDHKIPLAAFDYETPNDVDFKRAWSLSNLQPLWAIDNIKKGAMISAHFAAVA